MDRFHSLYSIVYLKHTWSNVDFPFDAATTNKSHVQISLSSSWWGFILGTLRHHKYCDLHVNTMIFKTCAVAFLMDFISVENADYTNGLATHGYRPTNEILATPEYLMTLSSPWYWEIFAYQFRFVSWWCYSISIVIQIAQRRSCCRRIKNPCM